ncbi:GNAT family N-acetyltransferase [Sessilibacter sp. MAH4]
MYEIIEVNAETTYPLRLELLRPNQTLAEMAFPGDRDIHTRHFAAVLKNDLSTLKIENLNPESIYGIVSVYFVENSVIGAQWQIRAMATRAQCRGQGLGRLLLNVSEDYCKNNTIIEPSYIWANARVSALAFYYACGYQAVGDTFNIEGVGEHRLIKKPLIKNF